MKTSMLKILICLVLISGLACTQLSLVGNSAKAKIKIVTSFAPLYSFTANLVGDQAEIYNLVPSGMSIHNFEPRPSDIKALAEADLLIINGLDLEEFMDGMVDASGNYDLVIVDTTKNIKALEGRDPHVWLSINNPIMQVNVITEALIGLDQSGEEFYREN